MANPQDWFQGGVLAIEADAELAERARQNLRGYGNVEVRCATDIAPSDGCFDAVFVNAGATEILPSWLEHLNDGGRGLLP
jgi:protein-L-isoaspartate(D-aspartate) O-methyltransferase